MSDYKPVLMYMPRSIGKSNITIKRLMAKYKLSDKDYLNQATEEELRDLFTFYNYFVDYNVIKTCNSKVKRIFFENNI